MSLDSTSAIAYGATSILREILANKLAKTNEISGNEKADKMDEDKADEKADDKLGADIILLKEREAMLSLVETEHLAKMSALNEIDSYIIKLRSDSSGAYKELLPYETIKEAIETLDLFASKAFGDLDINSKSCVEELQKCKDKIIQTCPDYVRQVEADEAAAREQAKTPAQDVMNQVNMDVTLPNSTCIKRAKKNKEEGNKLIAGGNIEIAAQHYIKAVQYCSKVGKPSEEEKGEVEGIKLSCNLNLAMCYLKLDTPASLNKAISSCTAAIELSEGNAKALFRRASAYEKLNNLDKALDDVRLGIKFNPENVDFVNMRDRLERKVKAEELKQKKVYSKMFG